MWTRAAEQRDLAEVVPRPHLAHVLPGHVDADAARGHDVHAAGRVALEKHGLAGGAAAQ